MNLKFHIALFIVLLFFVCSCAPSSKIEEKEKELPKIEGFNPKNAKYYNSKLGFEIDMPREWFVMNKQQIDSMAAESIKDMVNKNPKQKEAIETPDTLTSYLLQGFKYASKSSDNYSITIISQDVTKVTDIQRGSDFLAYLRTMNKSLQFMESGFTMANFSDKEFYYMEGKMQKGNLTFYQKTYATLIDRKALVINVMYSSEEQEKEINKILETMKFEK